MAASSLQKMKGKVPQRFRKLAIWQKSMDFISEVYKITEDFPDREKYGLTSQIRRAVLSIALNISEGSACSSDRDFARYLGIAFSSTYEVICGFEIADRLNMCSKEMCEKMIDCSDEIAAMISGFIKTLNAKEHAASCKLPAVSLS